ncbi:helix-turn-helix domain-containing protein [Actinokineospora enzanensis]|uniref:helix-turn-helix domain-containing protein n=1 Tax=Actinokineospora enzanensis TaxID=155975 RepID=UPI00036E06C2|nr:helix-turn-helix transcriptional regulator [Actinokineospora enzanensis]
MNHDNIPANATVRRWQLAETLRRLREETGLTHDHVIAKLKATGQGKWSRPKLSRIENQEQGVRTKEVEQLLDIYKVSDQAVRGWLVELAGTANERGWIVDVRKNLPAYFHVFLHWEAALVERREFETLLVPGLLQTPQYARALISGIHPDLSEDEVGRRVSARTTRQQILIRSDPARLHVILDEGLLERPVGTPLVMRNQLRRLMEATEAPNITIQVLPKAAGASAALEGPFSVLTLPDPMPDVGYSEGPSRAVYVEERDEVRELTLRFGSLLQQSLSQADSVRRIAEAATSFERS